MSDVRKADIQRFASLLAALSNPHRLQLLVRLASGYVADSSCSGAEGSCACVGELAKSSSLSLSTVSHHLKELYNAGLIRMERRGQRVQCCIDTDVFNELIDFLRESFS